MYSVFNYYGNERQKTNQNNLRGLCKMTYLRQYYSNWTI